MYRNFQELRDSIMLLEPKTIVVAAAHDKNTLEAVYSAAKAFPMRYALVGKRDSIMDISAELGTIPDENSIIDAFDNEDCAKKAVSIIREKRGDVLMKGQIETGALLKAALDKNSGIRSSSTLSHVAVLEVPSYHKLIAVTDGGMLTNPSLEQKADIVRNVTTMFGKLGIENPRIAALCASEAINEKIPETVDASKLQTMCSNGELGQCILEGPLSFDLAISAKSAEKKGFKSEITGDVDVFLVPNITVGNVVCKALIYWGNTKMAGCVIGAKVPIVLVSRVATAEEKLLSILICLKVG